MIVRAMARTDVGCVREHNEDAYLIDDVHQVYVVADGMGGHAGGERASALAVTSITEHLDTAGRLLFDDKLAAQELEALTSATASHAPLDVLADTALEEVTEREDGSAPVPPNAPAPAEAGVPQQPPQDGLDPELAIAQQIPYVVYDVWDPGIARASVAPVITRMLADAVRHACRSVYEAALADPELMGMGTTTTALCVHEGWAYVAHVGDSRCYVQRDGSLMQVTEDHSLVNEQVRAGLLSAEDARTSRHKNIITRSVGFERSVEVDSFMLPVRAGDQFVLCSDGLSNLIEDEELAEAMAQLRGQSLVDLLVATALERGGDDNVTVVAVDLIEESLADGT